MTKRVFLALMVVTLAAGGAFAQISLSAGIGGTFTADFSNVAWTSDGKDALDAAHMDKDIYNTNNVGGGFFGYFDATYVMASLGMTFYDVSPANKDAKKAMDDAKAKQSITEFNIGVYGKYPFDLGKIKLFPILGVDFKLVLAADTTVDGEKSKYTDEDGDEVSSVGDLSTVWFRGGVGVDIPLGEKLYLRPIFLYGIGTKNKTQKDSEETMNKDKEMGTYVNHGLDIKVALGFKL